MEKKQPITPEDLDKLPKKKHLPPTEDDLRKIRLALHRQAVRNVLSKLEESPEKIKIRDEENKNNEG